jgi:hypothetical protein
MLDLRDPGLCAGIFFDTDMRHAPDANFFGLCTALRTLLDV